MKLTLGPIGNHGVLKQTEKGSTEKKNKRKRKKKEMSLTQVQGGLNQEKERSKLESGGKYLLSRMYNFQ